MLDSEIRIDREYYEGDDMGANLAGDQERRLGPGGKHPVFPAKPKTQDEKQQDEKDVKIQYLESNLEKQIMVTRDAQNRANYLAVTLSAILARPSMGIKEKKDLIHHIHSIIEGGKVSSLLFTTDRARDDLNATWKALDAMDYSGQS